jgi:hypothetical protein
VQNLKFYRKNEPLEAVRALYQQRVELGENLFIAREVQQY